MYFILLGKSVDIVSLGAFLLTFFAAAVGIFAVITVPSKPKNNINVAAAVKNPGSDMKNLDLNSEISTAKWSKKVLLFALICYAVFLAALVFLPIGDASGAPTGMTRGGFSWEISYKKLFSHRIFVLNTIINLLLFFVLGALVCILTSGRLRLLKAVGICFAASVLIELLQLLVPTRASDACDILVNVAGAFCGALAALSAGKILKTNRIS